jgi:maleylpyruvate isomerase
MVADSPASPDAAQRGQLDELLELLRTATAKLLGRTISVTDDDWRGPSHLPGWSRGHVATHVARQADGLVRLASWARTGTRTDMYSSPDQREREIEAGALRSGLDLQVDLDTAAGRLEEAFESLQAAGAWDAVVELRGGLRVPARLLPLARLLEVTVHHVDLDLGYELADVDDQTADWLLEWSAFRLRERDEFPRLELVSPTTRITVGSSGDPRTVSGTSADLLGWLTGRTDGSTLQGSGQLRLPAF